jgi:hypothetical protein
MDVLPSPIPKESPGPGTSTGLRATLDPERCREIALADFESPFREEQGAFGASGIGKDGWLSGLPTSSAGLAGW